jgi:Endonuclease-reverse transcriptase
VGFYFKNHLQFNVLPENSIFVDRVFESIFSEVWLSNNQKIIVGSIYRPNTAHPTLSSSDQFNQFMELFSNILNDLSEKNCKIYIFGDFNLDALKYRIIKQVSEYVDLLFSFGFLQIVLKPTRCTPHSATLIDHVLTNSDSSIHETVLLVSKLSDHFPIVYFINSCKPKYTPKFIEFKDFSERNYTRFSEAIRNVNWEDLYLIEDVQEAFAIFSDRFFFFYNLYFPTQRKPINKNIMSVNPWMTRGLLTSRLKKYLYVKPLLIILMLYWPTNLNFTVIVIIN